MSFFSFLALVAIFVKQSVTILAILLEAIMGYIPEKIF